mmetsp:Transcript_39831/g.93479  ORF Transcript_39831/g.93479 Transcript_39831/m.93479 type:complete len:215 (-) Transcript_39831:212-856(-)
MHDTTTGSFGSAEGRMDSVEHPRQEVDRVTLGVKFVSFVGTDGDSLEQLVGTHMPFEVARVPHLADKLAEAEGEKISTGLVVFAVHEEITKRRHALEGLHDNVDVVGALYIVQPDHSGNVLATVQTTTELHLVIHLAHLLLGVCWVEHILDVIQRSVEDFVIVWNAIYTLCDEFDEHVMRVFERVEVRGGAARTSLEEFAAHEAGVHVEVGVGD